MNLVLANHTYASHMTDEGLQLQEGLREAGWKLSGPGYDKLWDVRAILHRYNPEHVFVQDKRDFDPSSGCPDVTTETKFRYLRALSQHGGRVSLVVKDAGLEGQEFHHLFCQECDPDAVVIYYHPLSVLKYCPWLSSYHLVRIYHSVNRNHVPGFVLGAHRRPLCGSGAILDDIYPLRARVCHRATEYGMDWLRHPGYRNTKGPATPLYLRFLSHFKVSFCSASTYGFSLRKIIESVACGCTVVTDLPSYDILPEIDRSMIRVKPSISFADLSLVFQEAVDTWDEDGRKKWAEKAMTYYDYRVSGRRLSDALKKV